MGKGSVSDIRYLLYGCKDSDNVGFVDKGWVSVFWLWWLDIDWRKWIYSEVTKSWDN